MYIVYMSIQSTNIIVNIKIYYINGITLFIIYINYMKNNFLIVLMHTLIYTVAISACTFIYMYAFANYKKALYFNNIIAHALE